MRRSQLALAAALLASGLAGCAGGQRGRAAASAPSADTKPRAVALQHDYVASPSAHFANMAEESKAQEAARKAEEAAAPQGKRKAANQAPANQSAAAPSSFPAPAPVPSARPAPAPEPVAQVGPCVPSPCIGGDPCIVRAPAPPWSEMPSSVALTGSPDGPAR
jgi:hypothetical protein